jgi:predicted transcriptional regulator
MKRHLDVNAVKETTQPIGIIRYYDKIDNANPSHVAFIIFLPDAYFANV